jgi:hypothetical protein
LTDQDCFLGLQTFIGYLHEKNGFQTHRGPQNVSLLDEYYHHHQPLRTTI